MSVPSPAASLTSPPPKILVRASSSTAQRPVPTLVAVDIVILCLPLRRVLVKRGVSQVSAEDFKALAALCKNVREVSPPLHPNIRLHLLSPLSFFAVIPVETMIFEPICTPTESNRAHVLGRCMCTGVPLHLRHVCLRVIGRTLPSL